MSQLKVKNGNNWESIPAGGIGVPSGGTTGQVLQKSSNTDYATEWANNEIPVIELSPVITRTSGNSSVKEVFAFQYGKVVQIYITFYSGDSVSAGSNSFEGTITGIPKPKANPIGAGFLSTSAMLGYIGKTGVIQVRVLAATKGSSSTNTYGMNFVYVADDVML